MKLTVSGTASITATIDVDPAEFTDCDDVIEVEETLRALLDVHFTGQAEWDEDELEEAAEALFGAMHAGQNEED